DQAAFEQLVRIVADDVAVFAGPGLRFVGVHHQIAGTVGLLRHEGPFQAGGETCPAAAAQAGLLHLLNNRVAPARQDRRRVVPVAACPRAFQERIELAVEIGKDAVLIGQHLAAPARSAAWSTWSARPRAPRSAARTWSREPAARPAAAPPAT